MRVLRSVLFALILGAFAVASYTACGGGNTPADSGSESTPADSGGGTDTGGGADTGGGTD